ncbi:hypothetical protein H4W80_003662 [Nonomuraea angiospora]|uniref:MFS transporter n=1 Tax=Nonomuraea angiospora TaxID=46172 RepID=A0ABR9LXN3_9ACTN|nr:hypothetical protein [Nonomuraea angiospora]
MLTVTGLLVFAVTVPRVAPPGRVQTTEAVA